MLSVVLGGVESRVRGDPFPYIECVFENDLAGLDAAGTLAVAEANEHMVAADTRRLEIRPNQNRQPRTPRPAESQMQDRWWLAGREPEPCTWLRREDLARRGEPDASKGELAQVCLAVRAVVEFVGSLCCGLPTSDPRDNERAVMFAAHTAPGNLGA